jgi:hypothetical protein
MQRQIRQIVRGITMDAFELLKNDHKKLSRLTASTRVNSKGSKGKGGTSKRSKGK